MERRYLVAALAIIATFAGLSRGFRSLQQLSLLHAEQLGTVAKAKCDAGSAARAVAKIRTHLRPGYPEEAQLLAEMNVPVAALEARAAQRMAEQEVAATQCARATALRESQRARRDAIRMRDQMLRANTQAARVPISFQVKLPDDLEQRIEITTAAVASQMAAQQVKVQIAANRLRTASIRIANSDAATADSDDGDQDSSRDFIRVNCNYKNSWQPQADRIAREAVRDAMRQIEYSFNSK
jgi:hypothetical protein